MSVGTSHSVLRLHEIAAASILVLMTCVVQTAELREGKLDVEEVKALEDRFRAAQVALNAECWLLAAGC